MARIPPLTFEERDERDKVARWRRTDSGWHICDPSLDKAIDELPPELALRIQSGANISFSQVEALRRREAEKAARQSDYGGSNASARA